MKKKLFLSLFWKFSIAMSFIVVLFVSINFYLLKKSSNNIFESEFTHHGLITAKMIAGSSAELILEDNLAVLNNFVLAQTHRDTNFAYLFILDKNNNVLVHTFEKGVPKNLIRANLLQPEKAENSVKILDAVTSEKIRDIAIPILNGSLGTVRIGLYEKNFFLLSSNTNRFFFELVLLFLFIGICAAIFFAFNISSPIKFIIDTSEKISFNTSGNLKDPDLQLKRVVRTKNRIKIEDEIDVLIFKHNAMVARLKKTYIELQATQDSFVQSEKMASLGKLSAGVAHEINNPISGMKSAIRRVSNDPENVGQNIKYLQMISEAINKIENVVGGLLKFSRKQELVFTEVNLEVLVDNVLRLTSFQLEKSNIMVHKNIPASTPCINASVNQIEQLILNLILNCIDAIDEKKELDSSLKGEINITVVNEEKVLILKIADNGIGMSPENIPLLFDPFFTLKKIRQGTGLGLAVCYRITEQHKAKITASANEEEGMTFSVVFNTEHHRIVNHEE